MKKIFLIVGFSLVLTACFDKKNTVPDVVLDDKEYLINGKSYTRQAFLDTFCITAEQQEHPSCVGVKRKIAYEIEKKPFKWPSASDSNDK